MAYFSSYLHILAFQKLFVTSKSKLESEQWGSSNMWTLIILWLFRVVVYILCHILWRLNKFDLFYLPGLASQQRAREVLDWRSYVEAQEKIKQDFEVIETKQKEHLEAYKKERESYISLNWRQRKSAMYRANKHLMANRPKEKREMDNFTLPIIIKGKWKYVTLLSWNVLHILYFNLYCSSYVVSTILVL